MISPAHTRRSECEEHPRGRLAILVVLTLATILSTGCLGRSPSVDHFVLGSSGATSLQAGEARASDLAVLIGPVRLPPYLDRPQMVRLEAGGEIEIAEFSRWLGGFEDNLLRAVSLSVAREIGSVKVSAHPSKAPFPFDVRVPLHVDEMIVGEGDVLRVRIRFAIVRAGEATRLFVMEEDVALGGGSAADLVSAHDRALFDLSSRIARAISP